MHYKNDEVLNEIHDKSPYKETSQHAFHIRPNQRNLQRIASDFRLIFNK